MAESSTLILIFCIVFCIEENNADGNTDQNNQRDQDADGPPEEYTHAAGFSLGMLLLAYTADIGSGGILILDGFLPGMQVFLQPLTAGALLPVRYFILHPDISAVMDMVNNRADLISADFAKLRCGGCGFGAGAMGLSFAFFSADRTNLPVPGFVAEILIPEFMCGISHISAHGALGAAILLIGMLLKILLFIALVAGIPVAGAVRYQSSSKLVDMVLFGGDDIAAGQAGLSLLFRGGMAGNMGFQILFVTADSTLMPVLCFAGRPGLAVLMGYASGGFTHIAIRIAGIVICMVSFGECFLDGVITSRADFGFRAFLRTGGFHFYRGAPGVIA